MRRVLIYEWKTASDNWVTRSWVIDSYEEAERVAKILRDCPDDCRLVKYIDLEEDHE